MTLPSVLPHTQHYSAGPELDGPIRQLEDSFSLAPEAQEIGDRLIQAVDRFAHLSQARYACVLSQPAVTLRGAECRAIVVIPSVQGPLKRLFDWMLASLCAPWLTWDEADFLILIDIAAWQTLDAIRRERLIYHELCHVVAREDEHGVPKLDREGRPMLKVVPHDAEFFHDEVERYGVHACELEDTCIAIAEGVRKDRRDAQKVA